MLRSALCLGVLVSFAASSPAKAQRNDVLAGLESVDVRVRLEGAARGYPGLDAAGIDHDIRARLEAAGLHVVDVTAGGQAPILEVLVVMYADSGRARRYAFSMTAVLTEGVMLRRGEAPRVWGQTWTGGSTVGIVGVDGAELLRNDLAGLVDAFVRDFRAANAGPGRKRDA